jgi:hypothetical protein
MLDDVNAVLEPLTSQEQVTLIEISDQIEGTLIEFITLD